MLAISRSALRMLKAQFPIYATIFSLLGLKEKDGIIMSHLFKEEHFGFSQVLMFALPVGLVYLPNAQVVSL